MTKNFILPLILLFSFGCMSKAPDWLSQEKGSSSGVPTPQEFSVADLNKDNVIDRNESATFSSSKGAVNFTTPLIVICVIVSLIVACCSFSSAGFFLKNKLLSIKEWVTKKVS
jgi:hypothetical protein